MENQTLVVGAPIFGFTPDSYRWQPAGHEKLYQKVRSQFESVDGITGKTIVDDFEAINAMIRDYCLLIYALGSAEREFTILRADDTLIRTPILGFLDKLEMDYTFVKDLGEFCQLVIYPRDLAMVMPDEQTIFVNSSGIPGRGTSSCGIRKVKRSYYGEGGAILQRQQTAVVTTQWLNEQNRLTDPTQFSMLSEAKIGQLIRLPNNLISFSLPNGQLGYTYEEHVDRYAGLLEATDGSLHLIIDSAYPKSYELGRTEPRVKMEEVISIIDERCTENGVVLHVLEYPLEVPLSLGFAQLNDGTVIMTTGEPQLETLVTSLVAQEKIIRVGGKHPFQHIPAFAKAGIRCLLNEFPEDFLRFIAR